MKPFAKRDAMLPAPLPRGTAGQDRQTEHDLDHNSDLDKVPNALERVRSATGKDVDLTFLNAMSKHLEMAIQMTRQTRFATPSLKRMAEAMAASHSKELVQLKATLKKIS